jgi:ADP-ribose pyrophosphatase YjhB (NUDIX family)
MTSDRSIELLHFQEPDRFNPVTPADQLPADLYGAALDHLVIACVDLVCTQQRQVLLVKRQRHPRPSWWLVGGRMVAGEAPQQTAIRQAAQEMDLCLQSDRLHYIGTYSTCFAQRHQPPQHHGSHTVNITYQVELTAAERSHLRLHPDEQETWQWFELEQALRLFDTPQVLDQALLTVLRVAQWTG